MIETLKMFHLPLLLPTKNSEWKLLFFSQNPCHFHCIWISNIFNFSPYLLLAVLLEECEEEEESLVSRRNDEALLQSGARRLSLLIVDANVEWFALLC